MFVHIELQRMTLKLKCFRIFFSIHLMQSFELDFLPTYSKWKQYCNCGDCSLNPFGDSRWTLKVHLLLPATCTLRDPVKLSLEFGGPSSYPDNVCGLMDVLEHYYWVRRKWGPALIAHCEKVISISFGAYGYICSSWIKFIWLLINKVCMQCSVKYQVFYFVFHPTVLCILITR